MKILGIILIILAVIIGFGSTLLVQVGADGELVKPQPKMPKIIGISLGITLLATGIIFISKNNRPKY